MERILRQLIMGGDITIFVSIYVAFLMIFFFWRAFPEAFEQVADNTESRIFRLICFFYIVFIISCLIEDMDRFWWECQVLWAYLCIFISLDPFLYVYYFVDFFVFLVAFFMNIVDILILVASLFCFIFLFALGRWPFK